MKMEFLVKKLLGAGRHLKARRGKVVIKMRRGYIGCANTKWFIFKKNNLLY